MSKGFLSVDAILAANTLREKTLTVPDWGGDIKIRALSKGVQISVRREAIKNGIVDDSLLEGLILVNGVIDPDLKPHHIPDLLNHSSGAVDYVLGEIMSLSGMAESEETVAEAEEDFKS